MANQIQNVGFSSPGYDYGADISQIERQRALASALQNESMQPVQNSGPPGSRISWTQGLAKALQGYQGGAAERAAEQKQRELAQKSQGDYQAMLAKGLRELQGTQAGLTPEDASGNISQQQAIPPNPMAAMGTFGSHPMGAQMMPLAMQQIQNQQGQDAINQAISASRGPIGQIPAQQGQQATLQAPQGAAPAVGVPGGQPLQIPQQQPIGQGNQAALIDALMRNPNPQAQAYGKFLASQQVHPNTQAQLDQAERHFQTPSAAQRATDTRARESQAETARHHQVIEGDPTTIENTAQAIASGNLAPLSGFALARPMGQQIMSRVVTINPQFDPTQFQTRQKAEKDFATGKQGQAVKSFNVAISHLDSLDQLAGALGNNDMQMVNKISNAIATQTGSPAPTNFVAAKKIVADEIVKAIVGSGGGVTDREEAARTISAANSPAQLRGVINTYKDLMRGQLGGLQQQYEQTTGKKDFNRFLSPGAQAAAHNGATSDIRSQADAILNGNR